MQNRPNRGPGAAGRLCVVVVCISLRIQVTFSEGDWRHETLVSYMASCVFASSTPPTPDRSSTRQPARSAEGARRIPHACQALAAAKEHHGPVMISEGLPRHPMGWMIRWLGRGRKWKGNRKRERTKGTAWTFKGVRKMEIPKCIGESIGDPDVKVLAERGMFCSTSWLGWDGRRWRKRTV